MENNNKQLLQYFNISGYILISFIAGNTFQYFISHSSFFNFFKSSSKSLLKYSLNDLETNKSLNKRVLIENKDLLEPKKDVIPTSTDVLGPFYVIGAPFRSKLSPISAVGRKLLIKGTLRNEKGNFVPFTVIDFWQANPANENYDIFFPPNQPKETVYHPRQDPGIIRGESGARSLRNEFRVRVLTDHVGRYEIESVIPPPYYDPDDVCECKTSCLCAWRCPHIHAYVQPLPDTNCNELITQLYFEGEKYNDTDKHFTTKTAMKLVERNATNIVWYEGNFDIVLTTTN